MKHSLEKGELLAALVDHEIRGLPESASKRNPDAAKKVLQRVIARLRSEIPLIPPHDARYLASALERALLNPKAAGAALGLIGPQQRPRHSAKGNRDLELVKDVYQLQKECPLKDNKNGDGAFTRVAKRHNVSSSTVIRAWNAHKSLIRRIGKQ